MVPERVDFSLGYPAGFTVYIDRKFRRNGCEYRFIKKHEDTHVAIYRDALKRHSPQVKNKLDSVIRRFKPVFVPTPQEGAKGVQARLKSQIEPLIKKMKQDAEDRNNRFDARESENTLQTFCGVK